MKAVGFKITEQDKLKMADIASPIMDILKGAFPKDIFLQAATMEFIHRSFQDQIAMEKIIITDKKSGKDGFDKLVRTRQIVEGMSSSDMNLVIFRDEPEVWMQYYMSMFLKKKTYVVAEAKHKDLLWNRKVNLTSKLFLVPVFSEKAFDVVMKEMEADAKEK